MNKERKNYLLASPRTGVFNYRRGIPTKYRKYFRKSDGSLRGAEWKETLKTASKTNALVLAARINENFEHTLMLAKAEHFTQSNTQKRKQIKNFIENYITNGG